jgi:excisionase family DNA binding protein
MKGTTMNQLTLWDTDPLLDKHQVAERLNVGIRFVERLIAEKRIAYIKVGRHVRVRNSAVDGFISANLIASELHRK